MIELFGIGIMAGLIALVVWLSKGSGHASAELKNSEAEKETIIENQKAKYANIHMVNNLTEPERSKLRDKWTRK